MISVVRSASNLISRHDPALAELSARAPRSRRRGPGRQGGLLLEALIASMSIGTAMLLAVSVLASVNANRRTAERLQLATEELNNQLERLTAKSWSEVTSETVKQSQLSAAATSGLPHGELRISVQEIQTPVPAKRLNAELRWQDRGQAWRPPVRMTAWVFASKEAP